MRVNPDRGVLMAGCYNAIAIDAASSSYAQHHIAAS
jgi:hypothetical protein